MLQWKCTFFSSSVRGLKEGLGEKERMLTQNDG